MSTEIYLGNTSTSSTVGCYGDILEGQSFTPGVNFTITDIEFLMYRTGNPGTLNLNLYLADGAGKPTGISLANGSTNANTLTTNAAGEWRKISFTTSYQCQAGVQLAWVTSAPSGDLSNRVWMHQEASSPQFPLGTRLYSTDAGSSWTVLSGDMTFKILGTGTLVHYYNTGYGSFDTIAGSSIWRAQSFTPDVSFTSVLLRLKFASRLGSPGDLTVSIKAADGSGYPTGEDIIVETYNCNSVPVDAAGEWIAITLSPSINLVQGVQYAIVCRCLNGDGSNSVKWSLDGSDPEYSGGCRVVSNNGGSSWANDTTDDFMFEFYQSPDVAPQITEQSSSPGAVTAGDQVSLYVTATGEPTPTYQWYKNDIPMLGETSSTLAFYAQDSSAGVYKCKVSNYLGDVWTNSMIISIKPSPYVYNPFNLPIDLDRVT